MAYHDIAFTLRGNVYLYSGSTCCPHIATREEHCDTSKQTVETPPTWHGNELIKPHSLRKSTAAVVHPVHNATDYSCLIDGVQRVTRTRANRITTFIASRPIHFTFFTKYSILQFISVHPTSTRDQYTPHYRTPNQDRLGSGLNGIEGTQKSYRLQA